MKGFLLLFSLVVLSACSSKNEVRVEKLSSQKINAIRTSLFTGDALTIDDVSSDECKAFREGLPSNYFQDFLEVPEDWNNPSGKKITVFYYGQIKPGKDTVVFYNGGPTSDSHSSYAYLSPFPSYEDFSFIFIDQRGTGCSTNYPAEPTRESVDRLKNYGSRNIVRDSEAIRKKLLGNQSWKIFGQSYGGLILHRYLTMDVAKVKSIHAHGYSIMNESSAWMAARLKSQKRVVEDYFKVYPSDREQILNIQKAIPDDLCFNDGASRICGRKVIDGFTIMLGFSQSWPGMHRYVGQLFTGGKLNKSVLQTFVQNYVLGLYGHNYGPMSVIGAIDMSNGDEVVINPCKGSTELLEAEGEDPSTWILNECRLLSGLTNSDWDPLFKHITEFDEITLTDIKASLNKNPQIPFYLYSGKLDVFVPVESFEEEIQFLDGISNFNYIEFPNSGHEGFATEELVWENLKR